MNLDPQTAYENVLVQFRQITPTSLSLVPDPVIRAERLGWRVRKRSISTTNSAISIRARKLTSRSWIGTVARWPLAGTSLWWPVMAVRRLWDQAAELLFGVMMVGDDRAVAETWVMGRPAYKRT